MMKQRALFIGGTWSFPAKIFLTLNIVPHAGYVFSGEVAASALNRIPRGHAYKRIFLL
ncbi:MAG: AmmeMemoRadiSam system protein B, partial [Bacteroidales bacterium]|nr:AmmeMemoRadiSam system protein B [Bacteroidales bacterium]